MRARARLQSLMALRDRRVTQAMQHVEACNRAVRDKELERDSAHARWMEANRAWRNQQQAYADQVASNLHHDVASRSLELAATRCDWWRARVDTCFAALQVAQAGLANAQSAAESARRDYMRACAKQQALATLMLSQKRHWEANGLRAEEAAAEDLQTNRSSAERS